jgi:hypothetical protein
MRIGETKTLITQTGSEISLRVDDINNNYAELKVTIDGITSTVLKQGVAISEISQKADSITLSVKDLTDITNQTYSQITQTAKQIKAIVVSPDGGSSWEMNPDKVVTAIQDKTGTHTCTFDTSGLTVQNGGFILKDSSGTIILWCNSSGSVAVKDIFIDSVGRKEGSNLWNSLYNLEKPSFSNPLHAEGDLYVGNKGIYLNNQNIYDFVYDVVNDYCLNKGLV